jgi:hypothetical protein
MKVIGTILLVVGTVAVAIAQAPAPEIDATSAISAVALISGSLLILTGRRKK